ncbi:Deoxyadenosine kinase (EC 2.7.1.76) / Deoxyguanosine kinase (EC 2.7.1.113), partial [Terribacillus sp. AE2B 122]
PPPYSKIRFCS